MNKKHLINIALAFSIFFVALIFFKVIDWSLIIYENHVLHATIASLGAFIALTISWLFFQKGHEAQNGKYIALSMGFLAIGILRGFLAIGANEPTNVVLHQLANLISAFFFAIVWLSTIQLYFVNKKWFPWLVGTTIIIIGLKQVLYSNTLFKMAGTRINGEFYLSLNLASGLLFMIAVLYFIVEYYRNRKSEDSIIGLAILLFGVSSMLSHAYAIWSMEWWGWHIILLVSYGIMFYYFLQEFKQTRTSLRISMSKYQQLFENTPDGIIQIDSNANIIDCNKGETKLLGYKKNEIVGKHVTAFLSKESLELSRKAFPILKKTGYFETQLAIVKKDGTVISVWRTVNGTFDDNGKFNGAIANTHDITYRKETENKILKLNEELEETIKNRTEELEVKIQKLNKTQKAMMFMVEDLNKTSKQLRAEKKNLKDSIKELESFAYSISHDLRAPLRAIDGFTRILIDDYASKFDKEGKRIGAVIQKNAQKMGNLIDDLLSFSRLGRASMSVDKIDMKNMVNAIYDELTSVEERKRIKLTIADLPAINGDTNMMKQVWINLISNAVKFSSKRKQSIISVSSTEKKDKIIYFIKDNGVGFNMKYYDKLFGVFNRLHHENDFAGTGVGLALTQRIIHRHSGIIWAESEVDKGTSFYISLPKKDK